LNKDPLYNIAISDAFDVQPCTIIRINSKNVLNVMYRLNNHSYSEILEIKIPMLQISDVKALNFISSF